MRPGRNGGLLQSGSPRPQGGRPPDDFYVWLAKIVYDPHVRARYEAIMRKSRDPELFLKALKWGDDRLHGKPNQPHTGGDGGAIRVQLLLDDEP